MANQERAIVRILAQKCDLSACRNVNAGSGVIIHPAGIILTAQHVLLTDSEDANSPYVDQFIIELYDELGATGVASYTARILADLPEQDLALLEVVSDQADNSNPEVFPFLTVKEDMVSTYQQIAILGYPGLPTRSSSRQKLTSSISSVQKNNIWVIVENILAEGYSGGPALIEHQGKLEVVGIVSYFERQAPNLVNLRALQNVTQLRWDSKSHQRSPGWGEKLQLRSIESNGVSVLRIKADLYLVNTAGKTLELLAYAYDTATNKPFYVKDPFPRSPDGQLILYSNPPSTVQYFVDKISVVRDITLAELEPSIPVDRLRFRLLAWTDEGRMVWQSQQWLVDETPIYYPALLPTSPTTSTATTSAIAMTTPIEKPVVNPIVLSGRLAYPIFNPSTSRVDIHIYCFATGNECYAPLSGMRQPDLNGVYLVSNGEGAGKDSIFRLSLESGNQRPISLHPEDAFPQWSPDGLHIVFSSTFVGDDLSRIYWQERADQQPTSETPEIKYTVSALVGTHPIYLSNWRVAYKGSDTWETWSKEGIYSVEHRGRDKPLMISSNSNDLPTDGMGDRILFMSNRLDNDWEVYKASSTAYNDITRLTNWPGCDGLATASPDGAAIAWMGNHEGTWALYVMQSDGNGQTKLLDIPNAGFGCADSRWLTERMSWGPP